MPDDVAPEYERFVAAERKAARLGPPPGALAAGEIFEPLHVDAKTAGALMSVAARRAAGIFRPSRRTEILWVEGESELAIRIVDVRVRTDDGVVVVTVPVRCDQTGEAEITVTFVVGGAGRPAGMFASTQRRPRGPALIIEVWGDALVAFAWQCVLGMVGGLAGAVGKDARGNVLVPVSLQSSVEGLSILPMARHRFTSPTTGLR